jgi:hypothetical protein
MVSLKIDVFFDLCRHTSKQTIFFPRLFSTRKRTNHFTHVKTSMESDKFVFE